MIRHYPRHFREPGEGYMMEDTDGYYVAWSAVDSVLQDVLNAVSLKEAKNYVRPHISVKDGGTLE